MVDVKRKKILQILSSSKYVEKNGQFYFFPGNRIPKRISGNGTRGTIVNFFKQYGRLYSFLLMVFSPVYTSPVFLSKTLYLLKRFDLSKVIVDLGSGSRSYFKRDDLINVDLYAFRNVDVVADANNLPFKNNCVDLLISISLLEHDQNPEKIVDEIQRVLKPGGNAVVYVPFIQPFHDAPGDYYRWTKSGLKHYFRNFRDCSVSIGAGPTSGFLWVFEEWVAILFCFGSRILHDVLFIFLMILFSPLKLFDRVLIKMPHAENIASGFVVFCKK